MNATEVGDDGSPEPTTENDRKEAIDAAIVEGYRRIPPPAYDLWARATAKRSIADEPWQSS